MKKLSAFRLDKQGRMRDKADPTDPVSELEELVEKQELTSSFHASNYMSRAALYEQLAEEASELSAASLKTARALRAENPTFITPGDASLVVEEKYSGVSVVAKELHIFPSLMEMADKKVRMAQRIERYYGADKSSKNGTLTGEAEEVARYNLSGHPCNPNDKGVQIIVYTDYTTRTIIVN